MAGLLDFLNTDDGKLGIALLSAAGPSMQPMGFGQRLQGAMQAVQADKQEQAKMGLLNAQLGEYATKNQLEQFQLQRMKDWQKMVAGGGSPQGAITDQAQPPQPQIGTANSIGGVIPQFSGPLTTTTPAAPQGQASPQQGAGFPFPLRGMSDAQTRAIAGAMTPEKYMEMYATQSAPQTDVEKLMATQGISKDSPLGRQILQTALTKANYTAPVNARPGSILRDPYNPQKVVAYNPHIPDGTRPVFGPNGEVTEFQPIGNAEAALGLSARATTFGKAQATPSVVYDQYGTPTFSTVAQDVQRAGGGPPPSRGALIQPGDGDRTTIYQGEMQQAQARLAAAKTPEEANRARNDIAGLTREMQSIKIPLTPQLRPGVAQGATLGQDELSKKWQALTQANSEAQNTRSYLDSIKQLSATAATGKFTDKLQLINSMLSPFSVSAMDATTANNLLDKYSNQIVARLGGGGMGTDAARAILQAAYPNAHMTPQAIADAVDNIKGAQSMTQAKARLLQQAANARDPAQYNQREVAFDQAADPRIWQLNEMPADKQAEYVKKLPAPVAADLLKRRQTLRQLGAF